MSITGRGIFFAQLWDTMNSFWSHSSYYRDIKLDNILRIRGYKPPEAMLTDFGCASDSPDILYDKVALEQYYILYPSKWRGKDMA